MRSILTLLIAAWAKTPFAAGPPAKGSDMPAFAPLQAADSGMVESAEHLLSGKMVSQVETGAV